MSLLLCTFSVFVDVEVLRVKYIGNQVKYIFSRHFHTAQEESGQEGGRRTSGRQKGGTEERGESIV